jgi:hypothetical protein
MSSFARSPHGIEHAFGRVRNFQIIYAVSIPLARIAPRRSPAPRSYVVSPSTHLCWIPSSCTAATIHD